MQTFYLNLLGLILFSSVLCSCGGKSSNNEQTNQTSDSGKTTQLEQKLKPYTYQVSLSEVKGSKAPSLQSFVHAVNGNEWLLFGGRTNDVTDKIAGGMHNFSNYSNEGFPKKTFNTNLFVYNVQDTALYQMPVDSCVAKIVENLPALKNDLPKLRAIFVNSNPQITQQDGYIYILGGYGVDYQGGAGYITYPQVAKIQVKALMKLIKKEALSKEDWNALIKVNFNLPEPIIATGGEMFIINQKFYLAGGHHFKEAGKKSFQKYLNAVQPFELADSSNHFLTVTVGKAISDNLPDSTTIFRRRDAPIVPILSKIDNVLKPGIAFYTGVFTYGDDGTAWPDAIYIHPETQTKEGQLYTYDKPYNQEGNNAYSCADFGGYDANSETLHTFLLGGIGAGKNDTELSFTNNGLHIQYKTILHLNTTILTKPQSKFKSLPEVFNGDTLKHGAEAALMLNEKLVKVPNSEIIDLQKTFGESNSVNIGYVYGGILSKSAAPGGSSKGQSMASHKIWKVTLTRKPMLVPVSQ
ncbi:hypothetical protein BKI52_32555 [marine bacterium AO1-C]|nr:hypothetical protein BKI52_32555 [marine bacterium AO1-C]